MVRPSIVGSISSVAMNVSVKRVLWIVVIISRPAFWGDVSSVIFYTHMHTYTHTPGQGGLCKGEGQY